MDIASVILVAVPNAHPIVHLQIKNNYPNYQIEQFLTFNICFHKHFDQNFSAKQALKQTEMYDSEVSVNAAGFEIHENSTPKVHFVTHLLLPRLL